MVSLCIPRKVSGVRDVGLPGVKLIQAWRDSWPLLWGQSEDPEREM